MSDRPANTSNNAPDENQRSDAWHLPETPGGWRAPKAGEAVPGWRSPESAPQEETTGWRVPALPQELEAEPENAGAWHLPKPEDTTFTPEDEIVVSEPAETEATAEAETAEAAAEVETAEAEAVAESETAEAETESAIPFDEVEITAAPEVELIEPEVGDDVPDEERPLPFGAEVGAAPATPADEEAPAEEAPLPFETEAAATPAESPDDLMTPPLVVSEEDEEVEDTFSMSELIALASLVESEQLAAASDTGAAPAAEAESEPTDVAEYARRQLERLQQAEASQPSAPAAGTAPAGAVDPAEYARQQLERLGQTPPPQATPTPAEEVLPVTPVLNPQEAELAQKYEETEAQVRELRQQYRNGQLSRDQLQTALRGLMVLDDNQIWWMMGVETDTWYKYEGGQWVQATPEVLVKSRKAREDIHLPVVPTAGSDQTAASPPMVDDGRTVVTTPISAEDEYMPLPRPVPVRDPDFTLPGTGGIYIPPSPSNLEVTQPVGSQPTVPMGAGQYQQATIPASPVQGQASDYVGAPGAVDTSAPPDYEIADVPSPIFRQAQQKKRQSTMRTVLIVAVIGFALLFLVGACGIIAGIAYYSSLASPYQEQIAALANYQPQFQTATILDAEGNVLMELTSQEGGAREKIPLSEMSPFFIHAVVSTENERFFDDPGWDPIAIGRALVQNAIAGDIESGASTITQQIARNLILNDRTVSTQRKIQEIVIASEIAQRYDKNFILETYLNEVFFGNRAYGVQAAAEFYFGKSAADLNMAESALLAGLIQAPATYDPVINPEAAFERMNTVLTLMRRVGCLQFQHEPYLNQPFCLTDQQIRLGPNGDIVGGDILIERAYVVTDTFEPRTYQVRYPHFVNFVQAQVEQAFGAEEMFRRGFTIRTTLIPRVQDAAQTSLERHIAAARSTGINTGAVLVINPTTGAILAMVGSPDFYNEDIDGQVNNVLTWHQPGSSIKPIVYAAALEGGQNGYMTPATIIWDVPTTYPTTPAYSPVNYDRQFHGPVSMRYALQNSYNVTAVKALEFIGIDKFREVATRMGLRFLEEAQFGLPSALGANEVRLYDHVQAYGALANGGQRVPLFAITSITDSDGNQVQISERPQPVQAISPQIAFIMSNILADNEARAAAFGLNSGLAIPGYEGLVAAKTGTTNDAADLWTMGYTTNAVVGVWTGTVNNDPTTATTSTAAIPIWNEVMRTVLAAGQPQPFANPGGVVQMQICADTGTVYDPNQNCANIRNELFLQNQPPPAANQAFVLTAAVDTWTGFRANQFCPDNIETRTFVNITDQAAIQWLQSPAGAAYAQQLGLPAQVEALPAQECSASTTLPNIRITAPQEGQQVQGAVQIIGAAQAQNFNRYQIEIAPVNNPESWTIIEGPVTNQQPPGAVLATWDTTTVPNGVYRVRLAAFANDGGYVFKTVQVGVNNPLPTSTPMPTVAPTVIVPPTTDFSLTPLPFDETPVAPANGQGQAAPIPTVEVPGI